MKYSKTTSFFIENRSKQVKKMSTFKFSVYFHIAYCSSTSFIVFKIRIYISSLSKYVLNV